MTQHKTETSPNFIYWPDSVPVIIYTPKKWWQFWKRPEKFYVSRQDAQRLYSEYFMRLLDNTDKTSIGG